MSQYHSPPHKMFPSHFFVSVNSFDGRSCKSEVWNLVTGRFSKLVFYFTRIWKHNLIAYSYIDVLAKSTILKRYIHRKDINLRRFRYITLPYRLVIAICTKNKDLSSDFKSDFIWKFRSSELFLKFVKFN